MGAANVEPAPSAVPLALLPPPPELELLSLLLLPPAATPRASRAEAAIASHWRDFTGAPSFGYVVGASLPRGPGESVTDLWRRCEENVKSRLGSPRRGDSRSRSGCG